MKPIRLLSAAAALLLCTACGPAPKPKQENSGSDAGISADIPIDSGTADVTQTQSAEQTAAFPETTTSSAVSQETETAAETAEQTVPEGTDQTTASAGQTEPSGTATSVTHREMHPTPNLDTSALENEIKKYKRGCAVLLEGVDGTELYSYHADTLIPGASLIKLPYVYYCCTQIEAGKFSLDDTMTYTSKFKQGGSGVVQESAEGTKFTLRELMDYALRYSDNSAYYMLVTKFGAKGFNQMTQYWGHPKIRIAEEARFPSVTASFINAAMQKMYNKRSSGDCWKNAWDALVNSKRSYAREIIGGTDDIAVKYGSIAKQYHEAILVDGEKPYVLVLLSGATDYEPDETFVKNVIADAKEIAEQYRAG
ncbi:MAG: serine hydrolase [Oscillospiraceae bacterium]|nr:serine hydrolase [Oscillospiraceae bacterium]